MRSDATLDLRLVIGLAALCATRTLAAQAIAVPDPRGDPAAEGCWTVRADAASRGDAGEALGLPSQLRIDPKGEAMGVREGIQRRASWRMQGDGTLQLTLPTASGGTWRVELREAEGEWTGMAHALAETYANRRGVARVTLIVGTGCPKR